MNKQKRLTPKQVTAIRNLWRRRKKERVVDFFQRIAEMYGVSKSCIQRVCYRYTHPNH